MSHDNSTTNDQQFVITRPEDSNDVIKGALRASGLLDFATKEKNECGIASSNDGEEEEVTPTDIDDSWLSDLMVMNTHMNNNNVDKQAIVDGSIFTSAYHDNINDVSTSLLDKYLAQKNLQHQNQLQQQQSTIIDNEEFDSYFNELFPDLAL